MDGRLKREDPLFCWRPSAIVARFCIGAFFGLLVDLPLGFVLLRVMRDDSTFLGVVGGLAIIPVVWGVASIFFLRQMTQAATTFFERRTRRRW